MAPALNFTLLCVDESVLACFDEQTDLISEDHPGFHDKTYRKRRTELTEIAQTYCHG